MSEFTITDTTGDTTVVKVNEDNDIQVTVNDQTLFISADPTYAQAIFTPEQAEELIEALTQAVLEARTGGAHGTQLFDADGYLWLYNGFRGYWCCVLSPSEMEEEGDSDYVVSSLTECLSPGTLQPSVYHGFDAVERVMADHGLAAE